MELKLYQTPHIDPIHPNLVRLLFERKLPVERVSEEPDYYMYVWINKSGYLRGFQAVLGDRITFAYHVPSKRSFGILARDIIHRGVTQKESPEDRNKIVSAINCMTNDSFPILLNYIKKLTKGKNISEVKLSSEEMNTFSDICRNK